MFNVGLGKDDRCLVLVCLVAFPRVVEASIAGVSTFGMAKTKGEKMEKLQIVEAASALR